MDWRQKQIERLRAFSHGPVCSVNKLFTIQAHFRTDNMIGAHTTMRLGCSDTEVTFEK